MPNLTKWAAQPRDPATGKWVKRKPAAVSPTLAAPLSFPTVPRSDQQAIPPPQTLPRSRRG